MPADTENKKTSAVPIVCIADPDEALTRRLADLFEPLGTQVRRYPSGQALLDDLEPGTVCVIGEARLPDMTGTELIGSLRKRAPGVPVILLASDGEVADAVAAMRAGALDFIEKPHVDRLLVWRLRHLLENDGPAAGRG
jgi:two-component system response regulator FixJ